MHEPGCAGLDRARRRYAEQRFLRFLTEEAYATWQTWFESATSKSVQIYPMGAALGYYGGQFLLTTFNKSAERGQKVRCEVTLQSDGQIIWNGPGSP